MGQDHNRDHYSQRRREHKRPPIPKKPQIDISHNGERSRYEPQEWEDIKARGLELIDVSRRSRSVELGHHRMRRHHAQAEGDQTNNSEMAQDTEEILKEGIQDKPKESRAFNQQNGEEDGDAVDQDPPRYELWHDAAFTLATLLSLDEPREELLELLRRDLTSQPAHLKESAAARQDPTQHVLAPQASPPEISVTESPSSVEEIARARAARLDEIFGQIIGPHGVSKALNWDDKPSSPQPLILSHDASELIDDPPQGGPKFGARFTQRRRKRRLMKVRAHYQDHT